MHAATTGLLLAAALFSCGGVLAADAAPSGQGDLPGHASGRAGPQLPPAVARIYAEGIALMSKAQWQAAIDKFNLALRQAPDSGALLENRGRCHQRLGKRELALADFNRALELAPERQDPLLLERGRLLVDMGQPGKAEQDFNKALAFPPIRAQAYSELAYLAMERKDYPACLSLASKAIDANRHLADAWVNRGACQIAMGRYPLAARDLTVAIRLEPGFVAAYLNRSAAYAAMGHCRAAHEDADAVIKLAPDKADAARQATAPCARAPAPGGAKPNYI